MNYERQLLAIAALCRPGGRRGRVRREEKEEEGEEESGSRGGGVKTKTDYF